MKFWNFLFGKGKNDDHKKQKRSEIFATKRSEGIRTPQKPGQLAIEHSQNNHPSIKSETVAISQIGTEKLLIKSNVTPTKIDLIPDELTKNSWQTNSLREKVVYKGIDDIVHMGALENNNGTYSAHYKYKEKLLQLQQQETIAMQRDEGIFDRIQDQMENSSDDMSIDGEDSETLVQRRKARIPDDEIQRVQQILASSNRPGDVLIDKFSIDMTRQKFVCLRSGQWLNDEIINFYMCLLQDRDESLCSKQPIRRSSHYFNSFFIAKLLEKGQYNYANVRRWTRKFNIFEKDKVFFPVNISNTHWTMCVAFIQKKEIHYYDSFSSSGKCYTDALKKWLQDESMDKKKEELDTSEWKAYHGGNLSFTLPKQRNGVDCGVFSIICADFVSDDLPLIYTQEEMPDYRIKIGAAILRGELSY